MDALGVADLQVLQAVACQMDVASARIALAASYSYMLRTSAAAARTGERAARPPQSVRQARLRLLRLIMMQLRQCCNLERGKTYNDPFLPAFLW